ncbi:MAG: 50S ribosomal protein L4, partial [Chloroflexota bacterium]
GSEVGKVDLPSSIFEANINRDLMHQALVRQLANARRGTHFTKTRSEVRRTTAKWYRQKGTGRARHGSRRAPIFVGGGVAHGPKPRSYTKEMPRKMRRAALRSALSVKARNGDIVVLDTLELDSPKTKSMVSLLERLTGATSTLILLPGPDKNVEISARNIADVKTIRANYLNIRDLLGHDKVVLPLASLEVIQGFLGLEDVSLSLVEFETIAESIEEEE